MWRGGGSGWRRSGSGEMYMAYVGNEEIIMAQKWVSCFARELILRRFIVV